MPPTKASQMLKSAAAARRPRSSKPKAKSKPSAPKANARPRCIKKPKASARRRGGVLRKPSVQEPNPFDVPPPSGQQMLSVKTEAGEDSNSNQQSSRRKRARLVVEPRQTPALPE